MLKKTLSFLMLILMLTVTMSYAQDKVAPSLGLAPKATVVLPPSINPDAPTYWYSRAFGYNAYGTPVPVGPLKFFLNNPGSLTSLASDAGNFVTAGSFDAAGIWWGIRYGSNQLVKIDTSTGVITPQGTITGAQTITGMAFDPSTNTMYCCNYTGSASNVGTLNMTTYVFTPLANTITGILIDMACSNAGQLYAVNISDDNLYSINKTTGVGTIVGPLGVNANYAQGMSWDRTVDSCYWASYTTLGELRRINVQTGASTLIGATNCEIDGFAIPGSAGPQIQHTPLPNTQNLNGPYVVNAVITPPQGSTITYAKIFWSRNNPTVTDSITMSGSGNNYTGNIPGNGTAATYRYYLKAIDSQGRSAVAPAGAPANLYMFQAIATDTSKPVITHTPFTEIPKVTWPVTVNCVVTDNIGVDSVWVGWRKNFNGAYKRFNLAHGSGNNWSGQFNSTNAEVNPGDTIYYRIIARDASAQQNKDSTALYNPRIINQTTACIGTGTSSSNYPYTTYWMDGRTQILLLASEILANQGAAGAIQKIGFNVISTDNSPMNGFKVQMQHTTATTLTGFVSTGWTTCYSGTYTIPGTGWQYINLTTPFVWNGTSNLLIEVCYNNSSYTVYQPVYATSAPNMTWGQYTDLPTGDGCTQLTAGAAQTIRPNTCLVISVSGVENNTSTMPTEYKLSQNYPNPFNPVTKISFDIPKQGLVTLKVYDVLGREVRTLVNEVKNAGRYTVDFNGIELASGVYFYKLEVNGFMDVKRMMLIK